MAEAKRSRTIREATVADARAIRELYGFGEVEEFAARLVDPPTAPGTTHYVAESDGEMVAAFALTALGRLRPGGRDRLMLHEIKLRPSVRGAGVAEDILAWLETGRAVGTERELLALAPLGQRPAAFDQFGLSESHQVFKWAMVEGDRRT
ncbi:GNAT family N-acetyltransferase [Streptomyces sp. NPDC086796]|uniref:GNAT family N-acetyltransferase n=1 Tax=unclassified Streptomyces TaxID=2593676 RepID=UPI003801BA90